jgi:hypothetical protein
MHRLPYFYITGGDPIYTHAFGILGYTAGEYPAEKPRKPGKVKIVSE